ncbi:MAG TPA: Ig-like domain-containing protein [Gemmatimonadaceae bacterium]|nr:Ig-like domain-containing protein [Gemmatimonadaceae bacterium]
MTSVTVEPASASINVGGDVTLRATPRNAAGLDVVGQTVTWSSNAPAVASVSASGVVTGVTAGSASIVATVAGVSGNAAITVVPPAADTVVASVTITPSSGTIQTGGTISLGAAAQNAAGQPLGGKAFTWTSAAPAIATVSAGGMVTGVSAGTAVITAASQGKSANANITVTAAADSAVASVAVLPATTSIVVGATAALGATPRNAAGQPVAGQTVTWSSSNTSIASVNASGVVTGVSIGGPVTITASTGSKSGSASVSVVAAPSSSGTIAVNGAQTFQTMTGWEALMEIGQAECDPRAYQTYKNEVLDRAANEVGVNRIRMGLRNGFENPVDEFLKLKAGLITFTDWNKTWFRVVNDNADPFNINPAGFNWGYLDYTIEELIIPLKARLRARGDDLWWSISYTGANSGQLHRDNPEEYAEFVFAAFQHMQQKYGMVPNSLELVNEPNIGQWSAQQVAYNLLAAKRRLNQGGFFPQFVGPTASSAYASMQMFDQMIVIPGVAQALNEISWHRFGDNQPAYLQGLAQRGAQYGMRTAMLEHGGSGYQQLHEDLTLANVSAWQQFGLAFCGNIDDGGVYFLVTGAKFGENNPVVNTGWMTKYLRQYYRYVGLGAVRLGASSSDARFAPIAFRNANGKHVVVVKATAGGTFTVGGLPAGTYGIDYTTSSDYMRALSDVTISGSQSISTSIPATGVLTIFAK